MAGSAVNAIVSENTATPYVVAGIGDPGQREQTTENDEIQMPNDEIGSSARLLASSLVINSSFVLRHCLPHSTFVFRHFMDAGLSTSNAFAS
jgi:hypothetical protein